jgi:hypothetical protein
MKAILLATLLVAPAALAADPYIPTDAERARWTMHDMKSWMIVFEAYKSDHKEYPHVSSVEDARAAGEPMYIRHAPMTDAWGHPYRIESNGQSFRIVSAGADGIFQTDLSEKGTLKSFNDDAVATNEGKWLVRQWEFR